MRSMGWPLEGVPRGGAGNLGHGTTIVGEVDFRFTDQVSLGITGNLVDSGYKMEENGLANNGLVG